MYRWHRVAQVSRGKFFEALQWAKQISEYVNANHSPGNAQAYLELFGQTGTIHWYADYDDLSTLEKVNQALLADPKYAAMLNEATGLFIEGKTKDTLIQMI